ncbi:Transglycosylase SLT domain-containing protein [Sphingobium faniae]|nr:Transglycosylase SLT domain-containing protein [Sphingobium faniae]
MLNDITMSAESGGRRYGRNGGLLTSMAGAMGEMQVMPGTARDPGFGVRPWQGGADDLARVGRDYRAAMQKRYGGEPDKMWAAYNWGPGNLDKAIASHGPGWMNAAPAETRNYIARNLRALGGH